MRQFAVPLASFLLLTLSCQHAGEEPTKSYANQRQPELDTLAKNRENWRINHPQSYGLEITQSIRMGLKIIHQLHIENEKVVAAGGSPMSPKQFRLDFKESMETYFDIAEQALIEAEEIEILYDKSLGYPYRIALDGELDTIGDAMHFELRVVEHAPFRPAFIPQISESR